MRVCVCAVVLDVTTVVDIVFFVDKPNVDQPVPGVARPLRVRVIVRVASESGADIKEAAVGYSCSQEGQLNTSP